MKLEYIKLTWDYTEYTISKEHVYKLDYEVLDEYNLKSIYLELDLYYLKESKYFDMIEFSPWSIIINDHDYNFPYIPDTSKMSDGHTYDNSLYSYIINDNKLIIDMKIKD